MQLSCTFLRRYLLYDKGIMKEIVDVIMKGIVNVIVKSLWMSL